jgi:hypothetical protein
MKRTSQNKKKESTSHANKRQKKDNKEEFQTNNEFTLKEDEGEEVEELDNLPFNNQNNMNEEADDEDEIEEDEEQLSVSNKNKSTNVQIEIPPPLKQYWRRPALPNNHPYITANSSIAFQQMDTDYYIGKQKEGYPGPSSGSVPIIRLYGITEEGYSVLCHIRGYQPYFYIEMPDDFDADKVEPFKRFLAVSIYLYDH